jgi:hypothetical protein
MSRTNAKLWSAVLNGDVRKVKRLLSAKPGSFEAASFDINETAGKVPTRKVPTQTPPFDFV